jgi:hypothetical protein
MSLGAFLFLRSFNPGEILEAWILGGAKGDVTWGFFCIADSLM